MLSQMSMLIMCGSNWGGSGVTRLSSPPDFGCSVDAGVAAAGAGAGTLVAARVLVAAIGALVGASGAAVGFGAPADVGTALGTDVQAVRSASAVLPPRTRKAARRLSAPVTARPPEYAPRSPAPCA